MKNIKGKLSREEQDRLRFRKSFPMLPESMLLSEKLIGHDMTIKFIRQFGGLRLKFSTHPKMDNELISLLGDKNYAILRDKLFGTDKIQVPICRAYLAMLDARRLYQEGATIREIVRKLTIPFSQATHYCRGYRQRADHRVVHPDGEE